MTEHKVNVDNHIGLKLSDLTWTTIRHGTHEYSAAPCSVNLFGFPTECIVVRQDTGRRYRWMSTAEDCVKKLISWGLPDTDAKLLVLEADEGRKTKEN